MKGRCYYCNKELTERTIKRHMKNCADMEKTIDSHKDDNKGFRSQFIIAVKPKYDTSKYCLYLSIDGNLTLGAIDKFLRDIWVECCGHLSMFKIDRFIYEDEDMNLPIKALLNDFQKFEYIYDFGSSTELDLEVVEIKEVPETFTQIEIIARNSEGGSPRNGVCGYKCDKNGEKEYLPGNKNKYQVKDIDLDSINEELTPEDYFDILQGEARYIIEEMAHTFESLMVKDFTLDIEKIIRLLNKEDIYFIARRLGMEKISSLNKEKLTQKFLEGYEELIEEKLLLFDDERYKVIKSYVDCDGIKSLDEVKGGIEEILYFRNLGMVFFTNKNNDEVIMFMPEVIKNIVKKKETFEYRNRIKKNTEVIKLYRGMNRAYGVLSISDTRELLKKYNVEDSEEMNIEGLLKEGQYYYDYRELGSLLVNGDIETPNDISTIMNAEKEKKYADISRDELLNMSSEDWLCKTKHGKAFYNSFLDLFDVEPEMVKELMQSIYTDSQYTSKEEIVELSLNMLSDGSKEIAEITKCIIEDYVENIRLWKCKGNTIKQVEGKKETIVKTFTVGRNDPCPCGSGKKYKKCCGKDSKVINLFN